MLEDVSADDLSIAINRVGVGEAAKLGYFHSLPYGGGGGGVTKSRTYRVSNLPIPGINQSRVDFSLTGFADRFTKMPFTDLLVLNPVLGYEYNVFVADINFVTQVIGVKVGWYWSGDGVDPDTGGNVDVGLRVEPFVLTE